MHVDDVAGDRRCPGARQRVERTVRSSVTIDRRRAVYVPDAVQEVDRDDGRVGDAVAVGQRVGEGVARPGEAGGRRVEEGAIRRAFGDRSAIRREGREDDRQRARCTNTAVVGLDVAGQHGHRRRRQGAHRSDRQLRIPNRAPERISASDRPDVDRRVKRAAAPEVIGGCNRNRRIQHGVRWRAGHDAGRRRDRETCRKAGLAPREARSGASGLAERDRPIRRIEETVRQRRRTHRDHRAGHVEREILRGVRRHAVGRGELQQERTGLRRGSGEHARRRRVGHTGWRCTARGRDRRRRDAGRGQRKGARRADGERSAVGAREQRRLLDRQREVLGDRSSRDAVVERERDVVRAAGVRRRRTAQGGGAVAVVGKVDARRQRHAAARDRPRRREAVGRDREGAGRADCEARVVRAGKAPGVVDSQREALCRGRADAVGGRDGERMRPARTSRGCAAQRARAVAVVDEGDAGDRRTRHRQRGRRLAGARDGKRTRSADRKRRGRRARDRRDLLQDEREALRRRRPDAVGGSERDREGTVRPRQRSARQCRRAVDVVREGHACRQAAGLRDQVHRRRRRGRDAEGSRHADRERGRWRACEDRRPRHVVDCQHEALRRRCPDAVGRGECQRIRARAACRRSAGDRRRPVAVVREDDIRR